MLEQLRNIFKKYFSVLSIRLTLFFLMCPLDPHKTIRKSLVFGCFQWGSKGNIGKKRLNKFLAVFNSA